MLDEFIMRMIQAAIELFPIDGAKKADMLQSIVSQKMSQKNNFPESQ